jgi:hypothetical protein
MFMIFWDKIGSDPSVFVSPTGYMLTTFGFSLLIQGVFIRFLENHQVTKKYI